VLTGQEGQSCDGILVDPHQARGLSHAATFGEMLQDRQNLIVWKFGVEQRRAFELGEPSLTNVAVEQAVVGPAEMAADREVADTALAIARTLAVLAATAGKVVHGLEAYLTNPCWRVSSCLASLHIGGHPFNLYRTPPERESCAEI
jgi:hypothetical protein